MQSFNLKQSGFIPSPAPLPDLIPDLIKDLKTIGILAAQKKFIAFWGSHLLHVTNDRPTKRDYANLSMAIITEYPQLAGGKQSNVSKMALLHFYVLNNDEIYIRLLTFRLYVIL